MALINIVRRPTLVLWLMVSAAAACGSVSGEPLIEGEETCGGDDACLEAIRTRRVNGSCGAADGIATATAPTSDLCSAGTPTTVSGTGPWTWSCVGRRGGTTAECSAPATTTTQPPPPPAPAPTTGDWPNATSTGVPTGTSLTLINGDLTVSTANTVIDGKDIRGCVSIEAPGVTIRRSKVSCPGFYVIYNHGQSGLLIEDSEIDCQVTNGTAVGDLDFVARRVNVHGCENGFDIDGNVTIQDSFIHDLYNSAEAHTDGAQLTPGAHDISFLHNTIYSNDGTSAIISATAGAGAVSNVLVQNNLLAGGAYTLYCPIDGPGNNYRVIDNHFSTVFYPTVGAYGAWTDCQDEVQVTGNVYHETGLPVPVQ